MKQMLLLAINRYHAVTKESSVILERLPSPSWSGIFLPRHRTCGMRSLSPAKHDVWVWPPNKSWIPMLCRHVDTMLAPITTLPNALHNELLVQREHKTYRHACTCVLSFSEYGFRVEAHMRLTQHVVPVQQWRES